MLWKCSPNANSSLFFSIQQEFNEAKARKKLPFVKDGKTYNRSPPLPKQNVPYYQCHCVQMRALALNTDVGSTCSIKCTDPDGTRYKPDDMGQTTCPICNCFCDKAYQVRLLVCLFACLPRLHPNFYCFLLSCYFIDWIFSKYPSCAAYDFRRSRHEEGA